MEEVLKSLKGFLSKTSKAPKRSQETVNIILYQETELTARLVAIAASFEFRLISMSFQQ